MSLPALLHCLLPVGDLIGNSGEAMHGRELMRFTACSPLSRVDVDQGERGRFVLHLACTAPSQTRNRKKPASASPDEIQRCLAPTNHGDHKLRLLLLLLLLKEVGNARLGESD